MKNKLILASSSPRRKELLEQIGAQFEIVPAKGEEVITSNHPEQVVQELSFQKAKEVADNYSKKILPKEEVRTIIIGADTVVAYDNQILGKPKDKEDAVKMLQTLSGNTHSVFTGVTMIVYEKGVKAEHSFFAETKVVMYPMTEEQISTYVETGEPMDKAGAYGIQGKCAVYIEKIIGDYNNVVGLPIAMIYQRLNELGIDIL